MRTLVTYLSLEAGLGLGDRIQPLDIHVELIVESLLLHTKRSQLRCFRQLLRMPLGVLPFLEDTYSSWMGNAVGFPRRSWEEGLVDYLVEPAYTLT